LNQSTVAYEIGEKFCWRVSGRSSQARSETRRSVSQTTTRMASVPHNIPHHHRALRRTPLPDRAPMSRLICPRSYNASHQAIARVQIRSPPQISSLSRWQRCLLST